MIRENEATPAAWPDVPEGLSADAAAIAPAVVWGRIERYVKTRWSLRQVTWNVTPGRRCAFVPRLYPATFVSALMFDYTTRTWIPATVEHEPWGEMVDCGSWMLTYDVGAGPAPANALEAYRRLAEYWAELKGNAGVSSFRDGDYAVTFNANVVADALRNSGAADLLRQYR